MDPDRCGLTVAEVERGHILATLVCCHGNRTHAASLLGISLRCLRIKLHDYAQAAAPCASRTHIAINSYASGQKHLLRHAGATEINSGITTAIGIIQFDSRIRWLLGCPLMERNGQTNSAVDAHFWHFSDIAVVLAKVCFRGKSGHRFSR